MRSLDQSGSLDEVENCFVYTLLGVRMVVVYAMPLLKLLV